MHRNIGSTDRAIRILLGIAILSLLFVGPRTPWGYLGLLPLLTAMIGYCPVYGLFRISTKRAESGATPRVS